MEAVLQKAGALSAASADPAIIAAPADFPATFTIRMGAAATWHPPFMVEEKPGA